MNIEWNLTTKMQSNRKHVIALLLTMMALVLLLPASVSAQADDEAAAQDAPISAAALPIATDVTARLITGDAPLTVGDPAELTLEVTHPAGYQVFVPEMIGPWGEFEIQSQSPKTTESNADGSETTRQTIEGRALCAGNVPVSRSAHHVERYERQPEPGHGRAGLAGDRICVDRAGCGDS